MFPREYFADISLKLFSEFDEDADQEAVEQFEKPEVQFEAENHQQAIEDKRAAERERYQVNRREEQVEVKQDSIQSSVQTDAICIPTTQEVNKPASQLENELSNVEKILQEKCANLYALSTTLKMLQKPISPLTTPDLSQGIDEVNDKEFEWPGDALNYFILKTQRSIRLDHERLIKLHDEVSATSKIERIEATIQLCLKMANQLLDLLNIVRTLIGIMKNDKALAGKLIQRNLRLDVVFSESIDTDTLQRLLFHHLNPGLEALYKMLDKFINRDSVKVTDKVTEIIQSKKTEKYETKEQPVSPTASDDGFVSVEQEPIDSPKLFGLFSPKLRIELPSAKDCRSGAEGCHSRAEDCHPRAEDCHPERSEGSQKFHH